jgi:hypothetical protein
VKPLLVVTLLLFAAGAIAPTAQTVQERDANAVTDATFKDQTSYDLFRAARMAVGGGEGAVVKLRSLRFTGRSRVRVDGVSDLVEGEVEIRVLLPDHYLRIDASGPSVRLTGYAGDRLLSMFSENREIVRPPGRLRDGLLKSERAHLARLMLGAAVWTSPHFALTFRSVGSPAEMVDPRVSAETVSVSQASRVPHILETTGQHGFFLRMQLAGSNLPARLEYRVGNRQMTIAFEERRLASGLKLPHKITTADPKGKIVDEVVFTHVEVNPPLTAVEFNVPGLEER